MLPLTLSPGLREVQAQPREEGYRAAVCPKCRKQVTHSPSGRLHKIRLPAMTRSQPRFTVQRNLPVNEFSGREHAHHVNCSPTSPDSCGAV